MIDFTNPRLKAEFSDWPSGSARVQCVFEVLRDPKRGWRVSRATTDKAGKWCKPKLTTFSGQCAIVDGSNDKTYILCHCQRYGFISVLRSDFKCADDIGRDEPSRGGSSVFERYEPELYASLLALIFQGGAIVKALVGGR